MYGVQKKNRQSPPHVVRQFQRTKYHKISKSHVLIKLRYIEDAKASFAKRADVLDDFGRPRVSYMSPTSLWYNSGSRSFLGLVSTAGNFCSLPSRQHGPVRSCACVPVSSQRFRSNGLKRYADLMDHVHATSCAEGVFQFASHALRTQVRSKDSSPQAVNRYS